MPFANPIVAGQFLIIPAIMSPNYVPGVSGWAIFSDGSAEFNDADFRGSLDVGNANGHVIIRPDATFGAVIEFKDQGGAVSYHQSVALFGPGTQHQWFLFPTLAGGGVVGMAMVYDEHIANSGVTQVFGDQMVVQSTGVGKSLDLLASGATSDINLQATRHVNRNGLAQPRFDSGVINGAPATSLGGDIAIAHNLGSVPTGYSFTLTADHRVTQLAVVASSSTTFTVRISNTSTGAVYASTAFFFSWSCWNTP